MKNKYRTYSFWMSVSAAAVLVINNLAKVFGFSFDNDIFTATVDSICGVLVVFGVLTMKRGNQNSEVDNSDEDEDIKNGNQEDQSINKDK